MRLRCLVAPLPALAAAIGLAACGGGGSSAPTIGDPATAVPANVPVFVEAAVRPQGSMSAGLQTSLSKLLGTSDPGGKAIAFFDRSTRNGVTYERDIKPWLGERAGVFLQSFGGDAVGVAQTTDPSTAVDSLRKAATADGHAAHAVSYRGVSLEETGSDSFATVGSLLVTGPTSGVKAAIDAAKGSSLADSQDYTTSVTDVPGDNFFEAWADPARVVDELAAEGQLPATAATRVRSELGKLVSQPVVVWGEASPSYLAVEASGASSGAAAQSSSALGSLPSDSWLAFAVHETASEVRRSLGESTAAAALGVRGSAALLGALSQLGLDPTSLAKWVGDVSGFLRGSSIFGLGGALVVQSHDQAASEQALARIEAGLRRDRDLVIQPLGGGQTGFTMTPRGAPIQVVFTQRDGKVIIGLGQDSVSAALNPPQALSSAGGFKSATGALGTAISPDVYLDFQPLTSLFEIPGVISDPQLNQVRPYLDRLDYLVAGTGQSGGRSLVRIALGVRSGGSGSGAVSAAGLPKYAAVSP